jgi:hypothetical protein
MKKGLTLIAGLVTGVTFTVMGIASCGGNINSIQDPHFDLDGTPLDTNYVAFVPQRPESVKLYIETSGSMNGFFRANKANAFKKTVWSVVSGLLPYSDKNMYTMSNGGNIDSPISIADFRKKMNEGGFVSNTDTHIPAMLASIIKNIDPSKDEVAVLISDMKYSPTGPGAAPNILQYQEQIRNLTASHTYGVAFICATSEYLDNGGSVVEENSPYYYIVIGKPECVAATRNDIVAWCEGTDSFVESGDMGMNYRTPQYAVHSIINGLAFPEYPNQVITTYDRDLNDTCSFVVRIDLTGYPCGLDDAVLDSCFNAVATNGANVIKEVVGVRDDHHPNGSFDRESYVDYRVKVFNMPLDDEVVEWTFTNRPFDLHYSSQFLYIISADSESELDRSFSFNKFIEGHFNGRFNVYDLEPGKEKQYEPLHNRILISHEP